MKIDDKYTTIKLDDESLSVLKDFTEASNKLFGSNARLVDAEARIELVENILINNNPEHEEEYAYYLDQVARSIFGPNYRNFVSMKNKDGYKWDVGEK